MKDIYLYNISPDWMTDGPWRPVEPADAIPEAIIAKINGKDCVPVRLCGLGEAKRDRIETICDNQNFVELESGIIQFVNNSTP